MLEIKDGKFCLNGEEFHIYSGCIHYFRVPEELWEDRLLKLKAAGLNTVETYVAWNMHEPRKGEYNFSGMADIVTNGSWASVGQYVVGTHRFLLSSLSVFYLWTALSIAGFSVCCCGQLPHGNFD